MVRKCGMPRERLVSLIAAAERVKTGHPADDPSCSHCNQKWSFSLHNASATGRNHPFLQCTNTCRAPHTLYIPWNPFLPTAGWANASAPADKTTCSRVVNYPN